MYDMANLRLHGWMSDLMQRHGLADVLLVAPDNTILYSAAKGEDFAKPMADGALRRLVEGIGAAVRPDVPMLADFTAYPAAGGGASAFLAAPVVLRTPAGGHQHLATLVFRTGYAGLDRIMRVSDGMGDRRHLSGRGGWRSAQHAALFRRSDGPVALWRWRRRGRQVQFGSDRRNGSGALRRDIAHADRLSADGP